MLKRQVASLMAPPNLKSASESWRAPSSLKHLNVWLGGYLRTIGRSRAQQSEGPVIEGQEGIGAHKESQSFKGTS